MELNVFITFVIASMIMIALPGPSVLLTVAHSIPFGWKRGIVTVTGATMGIAIQLTVAAIGLTSLLNVDGLVKKPRTENDVLVSLTSYQAEQSAIVAFYEADKCCCSSI